MARKFIDLFCGLGAFHHVLKEQGHECVFACDIDERVRHIYETNYGIKPMGDITAIDVNTIPSHDILCGGFPCQSFSIAGNKEAFENETKGQLFFKILQIIDCKNPEVLLLENVKNLVSINNGETFKTIIHELEKRKYNIQYKVLNSVFFGSPQCRERVYIVGVKENSNINFTFPIEDTTNIITIKDVLFEKENEEYLNCESRYSLNKIDSRNYRHKPKIVYALFNKVTQKGGRQGERVYDTNYPGPTICASSGGPGSKTGLYFINEKIRKLNVIECLRMFGYPDEFMFNVDEARMIHYLGNSIVVNVIRKITNNIQFRD
jgi:DNA (cytosine-5)-methyltransferase 1